MDCYNPQFESQRVAFRKYLEDEGFVDALAFALRKLYGEAELPEDAILYVRQWICEKCATEEQYEQMKEDLKQAYNSISQLERELEDEQNRREMSDEEVETELKEAYKNLQDDAGAVSLLKKYLTSEHIEKYKDLKTIQQPTTRFYQCIKPGVEFHDDPIGLYPANAECYTLYSDVFLSVIKDFHGKMQQARGKSAKALQPKPDFGDVEQIENLDPKKKVITNSFISFSRNVVGVPFLSRISYDDCMAFETRAIKALSSLEGEYSGTYKPLIDIDLDVQKEMVKRKTLFKRDDPYLAALGAYHYHPFGRGVHLNEKETFGVWVNAQDHITVFAREENGNLGKCYRRAIEGSRIFEKAGKFKYINHKSYGFLTQSIENLGTGMRVSVDMKMPHLQQHPDYLDLMAHDLSVIISGIPSAEDLKEKDMCNNIITVTNKNIFGVTEIAVIMTMQEAITQILNTEISLSKGAKLK